MEVRLMSVSLQPAIRSLLSLDFCWIVCNMKAQGQYGLFKKPRSNFPPDPSLLLGAIQSLFRRKVVAYL